MRNTCIVLGAGFSKSIANLPVTSEMFSSFKSVLKEQQLLNNKIRVGWGEQVLNFISELENDFLILPYMKADKYGKILKSNFVENFEGLCSFIDLNLSSEISALCESKGEQSDLSGKPMFTNYTISRLKEMRGYLGNFLYLTLINDKSDESKLNSFNNKFLINYSSIISFNYDLVLEKFLFNKDKWFPKDGYGFIPQELPELSSHYLTRTSEIKILKMHGSLNWQPSSVFPTKIKFRRWYDDESNYFFPGYLKEETKMDFRYQGGFSSGSWILPSWIKQFTFSEITEVWNQAFKALNKADEIVFIGYSLPPADSAVYSLLTTIDFKNKKVKLYDPNAEKLIENYSFVLRQSDIELFPDYLENYL